MSAKEAIFQGKIVTLEKPIREVMGRKEFKVYVRHPKTKKIKIVRFGDSKLSLKSHIPGRKKSYCARSAGIKTGEYPKLSPNYWSRKRWKC